MTSTRARYESARRCSTIRGVSSGARLNVQQTVGSRQPESEPDALRLGSYDGHAVFFGDTRSLAISRTGRASFRQIRPISPGSTTHSRPSAMPQLSARPRLTRSRSTTAVCRRALAISTATSTRTRSTSPTTTSTHRSRAFSISISRTSTRCRSGAKTL